MGELRGEWWIIDGSASYADGDIGNMNHEAYVIEHVRCDIADKCGMQYESEGWTEWDEIVREITDEHGVTEEELDIASGNGDARQYGLEVLGWKRVVDGTVETWTFTAADRSDIVSGLWDMGEELDDDHKVSISVASTGDYYSMTIAELEAPEDIRPRMIDVDLANSAAIAIGRRMDVESLHECYRGKLGD